MRNKRDEEWRHLIFHIYNRTDGCGRDDCILRKDPNILEENDGQAQRSPAKEQ